ncbi:hypothetical protein MLD38_036804 [Melastoma candidum]|uniref:Uncharacterized protein n=1 Tax=Melastoma candidum TaxID=119954 RepID=A0ACB9LKN4_9MYRT|nr:hypothetical protein MLD38_036804 [Melastoma candidum]
MTSAFFSTIPAVFQQRPPGASPVSAPPVAQINRLLSKFIPSCQLDTRNVFAIRCTVLFDQEEVLVVEVAIIRIRLQAVQGGFVRLDSVMKILNSFYHDRDYARFFVLETIARVPYFVHSFSRTAKILAPRIK